MAMSEEQQKIAAKLEELHATKVCEVCGNDSFIVMKASTELIAIDLKGSGQMLNKALPTAVTVCSNCGNVRLHALGVLGLMPKKEDEKKEPNIQPIEGQKQEGSK
jgi:uncharacterized ferredoxin-like protein